ncbi:MAG: hypothetical protein RMM53_01325, partial [Bacteroidia bacterium]|nr:T9SS type A sorting domain-containing protein [Bacteroidia bacterium]MDW8332834.1 hypothetical protein [Bacteroidia bacterium]
GAAVANYSLNTGLLVAGNWADFAPIAGASVDPNGDYYLIRPDRKCVRFAADGSQLDVFGSETELVAVQYGEAFNDTLDVSRSASIFAQNPPHPNPSRDFIVLPETLSGEVYDVAGKRVAVFSETKVLDVRALRAGMYAVRTAKGNFAFQKSDG